jgi:ubiquinone/menaquinone biosynthesis C-methylase UbiE
MNATGTLDFGYPWWLSFGHLAVFGLAGAFAFAAWRLGWSRLWRAAFLLIAIWALSASIVMKNVLDARAPATLPTQNFLRDAKGRRVLDLGAGTGRSSIMVLDARPDAQLVAVDLFAKSFDEHFGGHGHQDSPQQRLLANLRAAGHADRATVQQADIRTLPFPEASFDAAVSAYVLDHLGRDGARQALSEAHRVLKPGGEFLFIVIANDAWTKFAFGPMLVHTTRGAASWTAMIQQSGFQIAEQGNPPGMLFVLARKSEP